MNILWLGLANEALALLGLRGAGILLLPFYLWLVKFPYNKWGILLMLVCLPLLRFHPTEGDSLMYHFALFLHKSAPIDNIVWYYPHLFESFLSPLLAVDDRLSTVTNIVILGMIGSLSPLIGCCSLVANLVQSGKPDLLVVLLVLLAAQEKKVWRLGLLTGLCFSCKMTGCVFLLPFIWNKPKAWIIGGIVSLPWLVHGLYFMDNPLFPFGAAWHTSTMWTREMVATFQPTQHWYIHPVSIIPALWNLCPAMVMGIGSLGSWAIPLLGAFLALPAEPRYLLPLVALATRFRAFPCQIRPLGRLLAAVGVVFTAYFALSLQPFNLHLLGEAYQRIPHPVLTVGEARKWPYLFPPNVAQGMNDFPVILKACRESYNTEELFKKLSRQSGMKSILYNFSICIRWAESMSRFKWNRREIYLWVQFMVLHTKIDEGWKKADNHTGGTILMTLLPQPLLRYKNVYPVALDGEMWSEVHPVLAKQSK